jgi:excisionase family DNA binding protein
MEKIYTVREAADLLKVSHFTIRSWIYSGKLIPAKLGSRVLLTQSELERFVAEGYRNGQKVARA